MHNHARTLLLNQSGVGGSQLVYPGDELIPEDFKPVVLPTYLQIVRARLFGVSPDRMMLNYRSSQLLRLVGATELQSYVESLDSRITYQAFSRQLIADNLFRPVISPRKVNAGSEIYLNGKDIEPDASGRCEYSYLVSVTGGDLVVQRTIMPEANTTTELTFINGLSQEVSLPYSDYAIKVNELSEGSSWRIQGYYRPSQALHTLDASLRSIGQDNVLQLFGVAPEEPYLTFYNCWKDHPEFAYRLGGIVMAYIYRTEDTRNGR
jgi:hypothetical protein